MMPIGVAPLIAGFAAGGILVLLSHLAFRVGAGSGLREIDQLHFLGRTFSRRESHVVGICIHLVLYGVAGIAFGGLVGFGMLANSVIGLVEYCLIITLVFGGVILPLEGHGLFGLREDPWFAVDLLIANAIWVTLFTAILRLIV
jgi:hypothetical protein